MPGYPYLPDPREVYTSQVFPTGRDARWYDPAFDEEVTVRLVKNNSGGARSKGEALDFDSGSTIDTGLAAADSPRVQVAGFIRADVSVADGEYCFVVRKGSCSMVADANITANAPLVIKAASAAGRVDDPAVTGLEHAVIGFAKEAVTGGAGTSFTGVASLD